MGRTRWLGVLVGLWGLASCGAEDGQDADRPQVSASAGGSTAGSDSGSGSSSGGAATATVTSSTGTAPATDSVESVGSSDGSGADDTSTGDEGGGPWQPAPGTTWQWQLVGEIDTSLDVQVYDIDLFDTPQRTIDQLHEQGRVVICYFSAGSYEEWRPDADAFVPGAIGEPLDGWPGEAWLDHRVPEIRTVMRARLDLAVDKRCDAVEPDNIDGYTNPTGFDLTAADQLDYNMWLATEAHARELSIGLKNDVDQVDALEPWFDWALNEECMSYQECATTSPFIDAGKAVFHVEYVDSQGQGPGLADEVCPASASLGFSTLIKEWDLTPWRIACP